MILSIRVSGVDKQVEVSILEAKTGLSTVG